MKARSGSRYTRVFNSTQFKTLFECFFQDLKSADDLRCEVHRFSDNLKKVIAESRRDREANIPAFSIQNDL